MPIFPAHLDVLAGKAGTYVVQLSLDLVLKEARGDISVYCKGSLGEVYAAGPQYCGNIWTSSPLKLQSGDNKREQGKFVDKLLTSDSVYWLV